MSLIERMDDRGFAIEVLAVAELEPGYLTHEMRRARCRQTLVAMLRICFGHRCASSDRLAAQAHNMRKRKSRPQMRPAFRPQL